MRIIGIDVSHWEGFIDWSTAGQWLGFAYMKCTDGLSLVDSTWLANSQGCSDYGIPHAPYHYYQPALDPLAQAEHFYHTAGGKYKRYIVDVEERPEDDDLLAASLLSFLLHFKQLSGIRPAIYTSPGYWNEFIKPKPAWSREYELIVAHYTQEHTPTLPIGWDSWAIWQFSDFFFCPGCPSEVDGDWFNGDLLECRDWFGNYQPVEPPVARFQARSYFNELHIRQEPKITGKALGHLAKGDVINVEDLAGGDVWVRHAAGSPAGNPGGWTAVEINGYRYMEIVKE